MRGAPQRGFARLISRISCRTSRGTLGLPGRRRDFQRQKLRNPARCHRIIVSGRTIVTASPIEALRLLPVHDMAFTAQEHVQTPVAEPPLLGSQFAQAKT